MGLRTRTPRCTYALLGWGRPRVFLPTAPGTFAQWAGLLWQLVRWLVVHGCTWLPSGRRRGFLGIKMEAPGWVQARGAAPPLTNLTSPGRAVVAWFVVRGVVAAGAGMVIAMEAMAMALAAIPRWRWASIACRAAMTVPVARAFPVVGFVTRPHSLIPVTVPKGAGICGGHSPGVPQPPHRVGRRDSRGSATGRGAARAPWLQGFLPPRRGRVEGVVGTAAWQPRAAWGAPLRGSGPDRPVDPAGSVV